MSGAKKRVKKFRLKEDGTYLAETGEPVKYTYGYQFSFVRPEAFKQLSDEKWDLLTDYILEQTGSKEYIGVYNNQAETSFFTDSLEVALNYASQFNQETVFDWEAYSKNKLWTEYYIQNPTYIESVEVNYDKIIKEIFCCSKKI